MIVVAVAERAYWPQMSLAAEVRYAHAWVPWAKRALEWPSATRSRWLALGGDRVSWMCNLLPPSAIPGAWNSKLARESALTVLRWAVKQQGNFGAEEPARLVMLGRRVERAFSTSKLGDDDLGTVYSRAPWGRVFAIWCGDGYTDAIVIPHPSGRNRAYNDPAVRARVKRALTRFCAEVK